MGRRVAWWAAGAGSVAAAVAGHKAWARIGDVVLDAGADARDVVRVAVDKIDEARHDRFLRRAWSHISEARLDVGLAGVVDRGEREAAAGYPKEWQE